MTIPVQQFPILSPEQANPFLTGLTKGQDLYRQFLINKNLPEQLQQQSQQRELANQISGLNLQNLPDLLKQQQQTQSLNNQMTQYKLNHPFMMNPEGALYDYAFRQQQQQQGGQGQPGTDQNGNSQLPLNNSLLNNILAQKFMSPEQKAQLQLQQAGQIESTKQNVRDYTKEMDSANTVATQAKSLGELANQFSGSYDKLNNLEKGPLAGKLPAFTSDAQVADNAANNMQAALAKLVAGGRVTNYEMQFVGNLKLNRGMNEDAKNEIKDFLLAKSDREKEYPSFLIAARKKGIDAQTAKALWGQYNNERPVYNFEDKKTNSNFKNSYNDFLKPEAVNAIESGQGHQTNNQNSNNNEISISGTKYRRIGPNQWEPIR